VDLKNKRLNYFSASFLLILVIAAFPLFGQSSKWRSAPAAASVAAKVSGPWSQNLPTPPANFQAKQGTPTHQSPASPWREPAAGSIKHHSFGSVHQLQLEQPSTFLEGLAKTQTADGQNWLTNPRNLGSVPLEFEDGSITHLDVWECSFSLDLKSAVTLHAGYLWDNLENRDRLVQVELLLPASDGWTMATALEWVDQHYEFGQAIPFYVSSDEQSATYLDRSGGNSQLRIDATGTYPNYPDMVVIQFISGPFVAEHSMSAPQTDNHRPITPPAQI
jgi:hypothetical protein